MGGKDGREFSADSLKGGEENMVLPKDAFQNDVQVSLVSTWKGFISNMEESLNILDKGLADASEMSNICTDEWCEATEHVIDELANSLFSISEPKWSSPEDSKKIRALKRRVHDLYAKYKSTAGK
jgi:hypothetical protein